MVYEDIYDAKNACDHLRYRVFYFQILSVKLANTGHILTMKIFSLSSGFNVGNRYLIVLYHKPVQMLKKMDPKKRQERIAVLKDYFKVEGIEGVE